MEADGTEKSLRKALSRLEGQDPVPWPARAQLARQLGDSLRNTYRPMVVDVCVELFRRLATDEKWEVRKAAAEALLYLQTDDFNALVARLATDPNKYVRTAAEHTLARRQKIATRAAQKRERLEGVFEQYQWFVNKYSQTAAERALKIGERYFEILASAATHEIRGVLTSLAGALDALEAQLQTADLSADACQASLAKARERTRFLGRILEDMKGYAQDLTCEFHTEKLWEIIQAACELVDDKLKASGRSLGAVEVVSDVPDYLSIQASRHQLVQVFTNVIKNAFEAIEGTGRIAIGAQLEGSGLVEVTVRDNGVGMDEADARDAFIVFRTSKKNEGGTGFGLPIAKKIVEAHGGSISLSSADGQGTAVTILLPLEQDERSEE